MRARWAVLLLHAALAPRLWAQPDGGAAGSFTRLGAGARAQGLGGAFAGIADDATALYWNPAGLSLLLKPELAAHHVSLGDDTTHDFIGFAAPLKRYGTLAADYLREGSGGFERRETPFDAPTTFGITNSMLQVGWGGRLPPLSLLPGRLSLGASLKRVEESVDTAKASGLGADAGLLYRPAPGVSLGLAIQNLVSPRVTLGSTPMAYPRVVDFSPAYTRAFRGFTVSAAARTNYFEGAAHLAGGVEAWYLGSLAVRVGMQEKGPSTGVGLRYANYQVDYTIQLHDAAYSHVVSLGIRFGRTREELEADITRGIQRLDEEDARRMSQAYFRQAMNYSEEGNLASAVAYLENAALWDPQDKEVDEQLQAHKRRLAESVDRQVIEAFASKAREQARQGNLLAAMEYWRAVLQIDAKNAEAEEQLKLIDSRLGLQERERLTQADKEIADAQVGRLVARGRGLLEQGQLVEAAAEAKRALEIDKESAQALALSSAVQEGMREKAEGLRREGAQSLLDKDFPKAVRAYQAALKLFPDSKEDQEKLAEARSGLQAGVKLELQKQAERLYYTAVDQYLKKDYQGARATITRIFELDPNNEGAPKLKAKIDAAMQ